MHPLLASPGFGPEAPAQADRRERPRPRHRDLPSEAARGPSPRPHALIRPLVTPRRKRRVILPSAHLPRWTAPCRTAAWYRGNPALLHWRPCRPGRTSATSPSSPTSTTARPRWSTPCSGRAASSAPTRHVPERVMDSIDLEREKGITIMAKNTAITYRGGQDQHRGHARPRRLRRRGRAHPDPGGRRAPAGRRRRGPPAPDPLRAEEGAGGRAAADRRDQQDRPAGRPAGRGARRGLRPVHRPRRRREPARLPGALHQRPRGHGHHPRPDEPAHARAAVRGDPRAVPAPALRPGHGAPAPGGQPRLGRLRGPARHRPRTNGTIRAAPTASRSSALRHGRAAKVTVLYGYEGLKRVEVAEAGRRHLVAVAGIETIDIGETLADPERPVALPPIRIDEPTVAMLFSANVSPFAGKEGKYVTSRSSASGSSRRRAPTWPSASRRPTRRTRSACRGAASCQLAILIEMMRREGYEVEVGQARGHHADEDGQRSSPWSTWSSTARRSTSAPSPRRSGRARAR